MDGIAFSTGGVIRHTGILTVFLDQVIKGSSAGQLGHDLVHGGTDAVQNSLFGSLDHFLGNRFFGGFGFSSGFRIRSCFNGSDGFSLCIGLLLLQTGAKVLPGIHQFIIHLQQNVGDSAIAFGNVIGRLAVIPAVEFIGADIVLVGFFIVLDEIIEIFLDFRIGYSLVCCQVSFQMVFQDLLGSFFRILGDHHLFGVAVFQELRFGISTGGRFFIIGSGVCDRSGTGNVIVDQGSPLLLAGSFHFSFFLIGELIQAELGSFLAEYGGTHGVLQGVPVDGIQHPLVRDVIAVGFGNIQIIGKDHLEIFTVGPDLFSVDGNQQNRFDCFFGRGFRNGGFFSGGFNSCILCQGE